MTLYDILRVTRYWQRFCCYVTNAYDQNVPIGFGTRRELLDEEQNDELFDYLMCNVDSITVTKDKALLVRVRDEHYNQPLEEQYKMHRWVEGIRPENPSIQVQQRNGGLGISWLIVAM